MASERSCLHKRPNPREIGACMPWLNMDFELKRPEIIVRFGATDLELVNGVARDLPP
jgi:uracil-DNA glycosylase